MRKIFRLLLLLLLRCSCIWPAQICLQHLNRRAVYIHNANERRKKKRPRKTVKHHTSLSLSLFLPPTRHSHRFSLFAFETARVSNITIATTTRSNFSRLLLLPSLCPLPYSVRFFCIYTRDICQLWWEKKKRNKNQTRNNLFRPNKYRITCLSVSIMEHLFYSFICAFRG
jgi:hypothetical protein